MIVLRKLTIAVVILAGVALCAGTAVAVTIPNGDFEFGNTGFSSAYTPDNIVSGMLQEGAYHVGTDPNAVHTLWASFGDHTSGTGNMMIVNGDTQAGINVWSVPVASFFTVLPNTTYYFGAWLASVYPPPLGSSPTAPANLAFSITGDITGTTQIDGDFTLSAPVGTWELFYKPWDSGSNTQVAISLINKNTIAQGNDFAIDDITFGTQIPGVPEPTTMLLLGLGLIGLAGIRKKMQ